MGFRFFRRIRIAPGVSLNLGKRGASVSVGPRGAKVTFGSRGVKSSVGIPGTGIRYETPYRRGSRTAQGGGGGGDGNFTLSLILFMVCTLFAIVSICASISNSIHGIPDVRWLIGFLAFAGLAIFFICDVIGSSISNQRSGGAQTSGPSNRASGRWFSYTKEMIYASNALFAFLSELNRSTRCRNLLKKLQGLDNIPSYTSKFAINDRLAMIAYCDARDIFRRLGHSIARLHNLEGVGYCAFVVQLINKEFDSSMMLNSNKSMEIAAIVEKNLANSTDDITIYGHENESRFALIFGLQYDENEWVQRYATLMYRWASLIAKADGTVTEAESRTLDSIMKMTKGKEPEGNVRVSGAEGHGSLESQRIEIPAEVQAPRPKEGLNDVMKQLDELIGLERVKNEVRQLTNFIKIQQKRKERGLKLAPITYHCVFTGNPGTGKTTVARILAEIYREMGIVKKGHLVETDRSGLIAEYVGQTAVKTNKIIDSALDGVLFIDEAYSLVQGGEKDYGREAIATLLKRMEDDRERLVVILAGYTKEMKDFIDSNPGLQSRFNRYIEFPDYNADELAKIFLLRAEKSQYTCDADVRASIVDIMENAVNTKDKNFGNARYVRNLFEKAIQRQATRLSTVAPLTTEMLSELTLHDLGFAYED